MASKRGLGDTGVKKISFKGELQDLLAGLEILLDARVLVGFPDDTSDRKPALDENGKPVDTDLTNAVLGYIHDNGAPEANIPQREFMTPGVEAVLDDVTELLSKTAKAVLAGGGPEKAMAGLTQVGFKAANSIKRTINEGIPPPLSDFTLRQRMKKGRKNGGGARKGAAQELDRRWAGEEPSTEYAKPLVDTAQMRNAVTFVIRSRKKKQEGENAAT